MRFLHHSVIWLDDNPRISACPHRESIFQFPTIPSNQINNNLHMNSIQDSQSPLYMHLELVCGSFQYTDVTWMVPLSVLFLVIPALIWLFTSLHGKHLLSLLPSPPPPFQGTVGEQSTANLMFHEWSSFGHSVLFSSSPGGWTHPHW